MDDTLDALWKSAQPHRLLAQPPPSNARLCYLFDLTHYLISTLECHFAD
jgi:hypothetical protein